MAETEPDKIIALGADDAGAEIAAARADPVALAVAVDAARQDPELARKAGNYLDEQLLLVRLQVRHFDVEQRLAIAAAKRKRYGDWIRNILATLVAIAVAGAVSGVAMMAWNAYRDHGLVVEAFSVPPDLVQQGVTGRVVAAQFLDQINLLQSRTHTSRPPGSFRNDWGNDIKVEIPETGVSIGELSRLLHERLGSATRIEGEIVHAGSGIAITARMHDEPALQASGAQPELDDLIRRIAEQAYAGAQPYRYGVFLLQQHRRTEALAAFKSLAEQGPAEERPWGLAGVGLASSELTGFEDAFSAYRAALRLDPDMAIACGNLALTARGVGLSEEALTAAQHCQGIRPGKLAQHFSSAAVAYTQPLWDYLIASELGDHLEAVRAAQNIVTQSFVAETASAYTALVREEQALDHDAAPDAPVTSDIDATLGLQVDSDYIVAMPNVLAAFERGDYESTVQLSEALIKGLEQAAVARVNQQQAQRRVYPVLVEALARLGRNSEADALLGEIPPDVYDGWRARGRIAALRQDFGAGEKFYAEAVRLAPSIPRAYGDWGDLLAAKGDAAGAVAKYAEACRRGPHYADAFKGWGDVLARQGDAAGALAKYDEALGYAPNWVQLKAAREAVAKPKT